MYKRQKKKRKKQKPHKEKEHFGYQPNNSLTIYYKKYIERTK